MWFRGVSCGLVVYGAAMAGCVSSHGIEDCPEGDLLACGEYTGPRVELPEPGPPPRECTALCGDATQDGLVDARDLAAIVAVLRGAEGPLGACAATDADVIADGALTIADRFALAWMMGSSGRTGCRACAGRSCGDANGDGAVDISDASFIGDAASEPATVQHACDLWASDVEPDGTISPADVWVLQDHLFSGISPLDCPEVAP